MNRPSEEPQDFVERILQLAIGRGASDLYWIPGAEEMNVRLRVDGTPEDVARVPADFGEMCVARIKVLAGLLTYRTRISQDGVIRDLAGHPAAELRVAAMPTSHGERVSIRLVPQDAERRQLEELGFPAPVVALLRQLLTQPSGLIVLTGPTGCGKTTTIYALIHELLRTRQDPASIVTIEDPIERQIPGVSQVSVSDTANWGYAAALRAALRHDVKTIVVGEMRDRDVVAVTLDAALTGHRVITTYHAGDIPSVYARILHQGFEPFLVSSAITGVVAQRLEPRRDGKGRVPVVAVFQPDDEWRDFIARKPALAELRRKMESHPTASLEAAAHGLAESGLIPPV